MELDYEKLEKLGFKKFDLAEHINSEEEEQYLLDDAIRSGEVDLILHALSIVSRAKNMRNLAKDAKISRAALYKTLDGKGSPSAKSLFAILKALNITLVPEFKKV